MRRPKKEIPIDRWFEQQDKAADRAFSKLKARPREPGFSVAPPAKVPGEMSDSERRVLMLEAILLHRKLITMLREKLAKHKAALRQRELEWARELDIIGNL